MSAAVTVNVYVPAAVGVPPIAPVAAFRANPVGRLPVVTLKASAPVPPVAVTVWLYARLAVQFGNVTVVIDTPGLIVTVYAWLAVCPNVSLAITVNVYVPAAVGVPLITPLAAVKLSPPGRLPAMLRVSAPVPPVTVAVWLYPGVFTVQFGSVAVVNEIGGLIVKAYVWLPVAPTLSVAVIVKLYVPAAATVPVSMPLVPFRLSPVGRVPEPTAKDFTPVPPVAITWSFTTSPTCDGLGFHVTFCQVTRLSVVPW